MPNIIPNLIFAGDFNCCFDNNSRHQSTKSRRPKDLINFIQQNFQDCLNSTADYHHDITYRRGKSYSTIDSIFAGRDLFNQLHSGSIDSTKPEWTDHALSQQLFQYQLRTMRMMYYYFLNPKKNTKLFSPAHFNITKRLTQGLTMISMLLFLFMKALCPVSLVAH